MKRITTIVVFALIAVATAAPSFAKEKSVATKTACCKSSLSRDGQIVIAVGMGSIIIWALTHRKNPPCPQKTETPFFENTSTATLLQKQQEDEKGIRENPTAVPPETTSPQQWESQILSPPSGPSGRSLFLCTNQSSRIPYQKLDIENQKSPAFPFRNYVLKIRNL